MKSPLVSVIIPTYNRSSIICRTIENVFEQSYRDFEVIVVDDGSTDDTLAKLKIFGDRIRVLTRENSGPAVARNRGVDVARGQVVAFQDSDDLWISNKLERQIELLERAGPSVPCCLCNAHMYFIGKAPTTSFDLAPIRPELDEGIWSNVAEVLASTFILFNQCAAIRTDALRKIGGFNEKLTYMEDYDLPLRLALEGNKWAFTREPLVIWRQGSPGSLWKKAMDDEIGMRECSVRCLEMVSEKLDRGDRNDSLLKIFSRELKRKRRELAAARVGRIDILGAPVVSRLLKTVERYRRAVYRRSPWYPVMIEEPLQHRG